MSKKGNVGKKDKVSKRNKRPKRSMRPKRSKGPKRSMRPKRSKGPKRSLRPNRRKGKNRTRSKSNGEKGALWWRKSKSESKSRSTYRLSNRFRYKTYAHYKRVWEQEAGDRADRQYKWDMDNRDEHGYQIGNDDKDIEDIPDILTEDQFMMLKRWFKAHNNKNKLLKMTPSKYKAYVDSNHSSSSNSGSDMSRAYSSTPDKKMSDEIKLQILSSITNLPVKRIRDFLINDY